MAINTYIFKAEVSKASLILFIANVPPDYYYFLVPASGSVIYGCFVTDEVVEYFLNEFLINEFIIIAKEELTTFTKSATYVVWGNKELTDLS